MTHSTQSSTPSGVVITATKPDGTTVNVTAGVQTLYDTVIQSMDWGSGFLTVEDAEPILEIAKACGFKGYEEAERYVEAERIQERRRNCDHPTYTDKPYEHRPGYVRRTCTVCGLERILPEHGREFWG